MSARHTTLAFSSQLIFDHPTPTESARCGGQQQRRRVGRAAASTQYCFCALLLRFHLQFGATPRPDFLLAPATTVRQRVVLDARADLRHHTT
jgi:hypothetical protein